MSGQRSSFFTCRHCADFNSDPWCSYCEGSLVMGFWQAIRQHTGWDWRWYRLTKVGWRIFGKCHAKGCWRRPQYESTPSPGASFTRGLACDLHVTRGCCWPLGTTVCCEWDPLPFFTGDLGEGLSEEHLAKIDRQSKIDNTWRDINGNPIDRWVYNETLEKWEEQENFNEVKEQDLL